MHLLTFRHEFPFRTLTKNKILYFFLADIKAVVPSRMSVTDGIPDSERIVASGPSGRNANIAVSQRAFDDILTRSIWPLRHEALRWLREQKPALSIAEKIWIEVFAKLEILSNDDVSTYARVELCEAIEKATGTKAPQRV